MVVFVAMHKYNSKINFQQKHLINPRFLEQTESRRSEGKYHISNTNILYKVATSCNLQCKLCVRVNIKYVKVRFT